jgi:arylamine N-acetyltransferase
MTIELTGYFDRIDYHGPADPTLEVLQDVITAHTRTIPFENLDPVLGVPVDDLGAAALTDKLVRRRRGGYCYEQNGLMGYVLTQIGFQVRRLAGRVIWMLGPDAPLPAQTHTVLAVRFPGAQATYLVDVGFGGQTPTSPIRFEIGGVQQTTREPYRLEDRRDGLVLQAEVGGDWHDLYEFSTRTQPNIDLTVGSWYVSTHPKSHFVTGLLVAVVRDDARYNLSGRNLAIHRDGGTEKVLLGGAAEVVDTLRDLFGINIEDVGDRAALEARIDGIHQPLNPRI